MRFLLLTSIVFVSSAAGAPSANAPAIVDAYKVAIEASGSLLVADGGGDAGRIFRIDPRTGHRSVFAGTGGRVFSPGATARRSALGHVTDVAAVAAASSTRSPRSASSESPAAGARRRRRVPGAIGVALRQRRRVRHRVKQGRLLRVRHGRVHRARGGFAEAPRRRRRLLDGSVYVSRVAPTDGSRGSASNGSRRVVFEGLELATRSHPASRRTGLCSSSTTSSRGELATREAVALVDRRRGHDALRRERSRRPSVQCRRRRASST